MAKKSAKKSPEMTAKRRRSLPASKMGLPKLGKYPVDTPARARNAKSRVAAAYKKGEVTEAQMKKVVRAADKVLGGTKAEKKARASAAEIKKKAGKPAKLKPASKKPNPAIAAKKKR
jgi:hypothetical protein